MEGLKDLEDLVFTVIQTPLCMDEKAKSKVFTETNTNQGASHVQYLYLMSEVKKAHVIFGLCQVGYHGFVPVHLIYPIFVLGCKSPLAVF